MKMIFQGIQKDGVDSVDFFCELERRELFYNVDLVSGEIVISNIRPGKRDEIVREVSKFFEITQIRTEKDDIVIPEENTKESQSVATSEISTQLMLLEKALSPISKKDTIKKIVENIISDINAMNISSFKYLLEGQICICDFGFATHTENHGKTHVIILKRTEKDKWLVIPINLSDNAIYGSKNKNVIKLSKDKDFVFYNSTYNRKTITVYLNRIQEVSLSRIITINEGKVTKRALLKIYETWIDAIKEYAKTFSEEDELEDVINIVAKRFLVAEEITEKMKAIYEILHIAEEHKILRTAFKLCMTEGEATLKNVITKIQTDYLPELSYNKIDKQLRKEFVEWFSGLYPELFEKNTKVSLAEVLKNLVNQIKQKQ